LLRCNWLSALSLTGTLRHRKIYRQSKKNSSPLGDARAILEVPIQELSGTQIKPDPLFALFGVSLPTLQLTKMNKDVIAFVTLFNETIHFTEMEIICTPNSCCLD
jgi:hypothetical protein